jgi:hypothetical protein
MCDAPATGREHVPPKCIFPNGASHRMKLISVPSCDRHNSEKSKSDELLRFVLAAAPGVNELALTVVEGSVMRSLDYSPSLVDTFMPGLQLVQCGQFETGGFRLDRGRFDCSVTSIVCGLFFHETGRKLTSKLRIAWGPMMAPDYSDAPFLKLIRDGERVLSANYVGSNPRAFQYSFSISNSKSTSLCRLRFYEGHPIYVTWKNFSANSHDD